MTKAPEISLDLLGISAINSFKRSNSGTREAMMSTHVGQSPVVVGNEPRKIFTGAEAEIAEYDFLIKFPVDVKILHIINKYVPTMGQGSIRDNPITYIFYEDYHDPKKTVGVLAVPKFASHHKDFGYTLHKRKDVWERIRVGAYISADEIIACSSAVKGDLSYGMGIEAETAFLSVPSTIEDGQWVSESFLKRMGAEGSQMRIASWGNKMFPLNLYGDSTYYKPFPDIGDRVRDDGLLFALREHNPEMAVTEMTPRALREVDYTFDRTIYVNQPGALITDVTVYYDDRLNPSPTPLGMSAQAMKYYEAGAVFHRAVMAFYTARLNRWGRKLYITPALNQLVWEAQVYLPSNEKRKLSRQYRLDQLDEFRVEISYQYQLKAGMGFKYTDLHGGKGVVCQVSADASMPVDQNGNRADCVIYGMSTIRRMNIGRAYEQFLNAASRDLTHRIRRNADLDPKVSATKMQAMQATMNNVFVEESWDLLIRYYEMVSPPMHALLVDDHDGHERHVKSVLEDGIYLYLPPDSPNDFIDMCRNIRDSEYCPHYGPVTYMGPDGTLVTTVGPVLIGSLYMIMLEKTGEDVSGVASVNRNHFGVPARLNNQDKQSKPLREQPVRCSGESETRSQVSTAGPEFTVELLDLSNNPAAHRRGVEHILESDRPSDIDRLVDRNEIPYGGSRPVLLVKHLLECQGMKFVYEKSE